MDGKREMDLTIGYRCLGKKMVKERLMSKQHRSPWQLIHGNVGLRAKSINYSGPSPDRRPHSSIEFGYKNGELIYSDFDRLSMERMRPKTAVAMTQQQQQQQQPQPCFVSSLSLHSLGSVLRVDKLNADKQKSNFIKPPLKPGAKCRSLTDNGLTSSTVNWSGRMFHKEKTNTTKGERDIMLGIFKNRRTSHNTQNLEYLIRHNYIMRHTDAWRITDDPDDQQEGRNEVIQREINRIDRWKDERDDDVSQCSHLQLNNISVNGKSQIISDKKECRPRSLSRSLPTPTPRSRSGQGQRPFSVVPNLAIETSRSKLGQKGLCSECKAQLQSAQKYNSADLVAPPSSPDPEQWEEDPFIGNDDGTDAEEFQMSLMDGKYQKCSSKGGPKKRASKQRFKDTSLECPTGKKSFDIYIPCI